MAQLNGELFHWKKLAREEVPCPLCGSRDYRLYERYGEERQYSYVRCRACQFIFQNPRFVYDDAFLAWAYSWYGNDFIAAHGSDVYPSQEGNRYFAFKKGILDRYVTKRPYHLLDIGCACGQFLAFCHGKDCVATGLEASENQVAHARKHLPFEVIEGTTADIQDRVGAFDAVHIAHTLEHVPDPVQVVEEMKRITKPGGLLFIEVPNVRSFKNYADHLSSRAGLRKNTWKPGDFPEHLVEFTPATLKALVRRTGLELVYFQCHSRSALNKRPLMAKIDLGMNRLLPLGNNLICVARKPYSPASVS